jgi:hypothetical protein
MKKKLYTVFIDGELTKITKEEFHQANQRARAHQTFWVNHSLAHLNQIETSTCR